MVVDRTLLEEYPFEGDFYDNKVNENLPLDKQEEIEVLVLHTRCDIQESKKTDVYVYFPFDKEKGIDVKRGMSFKGSMYGMNVNGNVLGVFPTQMGGCVCYITDVDV